MQERKKMTWQEDENLVQVQQQCSVHFYMKIIFESLFYWLIWPFECLILMILTITKYYENLLRDRPLSLLSSFHSKIHFLLGSQDVSKNAK